MPSFLALPFELKTLIIDIALSPLADKKSECLSITCESCLDSITQDFTILARTIISACPEAKDIIEQVCRQHCDHANKELSDLCSSGECTYSKEELWWMRTLARYDYLMARLGFARDVVDTHEFAEWFEEE